MAAKLSSVLRAVGPETIADLLSEGPLPPEAGIKAQGIRLESTRLQAPLCFWSVYAVEISGSASSPLWVTAKTFFDDSIFTHYAQQISMHYGDRVGDLLHPQGGIVIFPHKATVVWSFPYDPALPGLAMALENSAVAPILGAAPDALRVETVRYTPEIGAMLRYLAGGETLAYGKASSQERGATAFAALSALHLIQRRHQERVRFPEPLGYLPEAKLMLQRPVPGRPLAGDRSSPRFAEAMEAAAAALVTIHTSAVPVGRPRLLEEELARLQGMLQEFPYTAPQLYLALRKLLGHIESRGSKERLSPLVPSHGDFKYDQLLWDSQGFSLIDFEYFCQA
ncbi:MAG TPA: phosphotransferase, partial [Dehalococcoidia bacterium]|nr:phosphotransferase [Dehalococcoidia bacterium]